MIVSAPYRSGATSLCIELARQHNLTFAGQIDQNSIPFTTSEDKNLIHEHTNQPVHSIEGLVDMFDNDSQVVILNNSMPALFPRTDVFIVRSDLSQTYYSLFKVWAKVYPHANIHTMDRAFKVMTYFNSLLFAYMKKHNIKPLILEEQSWYNYKSPATIPTEWDEVIRPHVEYVKRFQ